MTVPARPSLYVLLVMSATLALSPVANAADSAVLTWVPQMLAEPTPLWEGWRITEADYPSSGSG